MIILHFSPYIPWYKSVHPPQGVTIAQARTMNPLAQSLNTCKHYYSAPCSLILSYLFPFFFFLRYGWRDIRFLLRFFFQSTELRSKANKAPFPSNESEKLLHWHLVVIALSHCNDDVIEIVFDLSMYVSLSLVSRSNLNLTVLPMSSQIKHFGLYTLFIQVCICMLTFSSGIYKVSFLFPGRLDGENSGFWERRCATVGRGDWAFQCASYACFCPTEIQHLAASESAVVRLSVTHNFRCITIDLPHLPSLSPVEYTCVVLFMLFVSQAGA
jgi:hypothetical protein